MPKEELVMLAEDVIYTPNQLEESQYIKEPKLDGSRTLWVNGRLINRRGIDVTNQYPQIKINESCIIDGELSYFKDGVCRFNEGRKKENWDKCILVVFDVLSFCNEKLLKKPLIERKEYLKKISGTNFKIIDDLNLENTEEGYMLKEKDSQYIFGRTDKWKKVKYIKQAIIKAVKYENNSDGSITAETENGVRVKVGRDQDIARNNIEEKGFCDIEINYLEYNNITKRYRQPTLKEVKQ